jgi:putative two-component system response regulator
MNGLSFISPGRNKPRLSPHTPAFRNRYLDRENDLQTILVVDDTPNNIDVLSGILRPEYRVKAALDGERALRIARAEPQPDIILLDIMMPEIDGYEVLRRLKGDPRTSAIPVIFVTHMTEVEDETRGFELGAVDYITKPISPPVVLARVRTHLALYEQSRVLEIKVRERTEELHETRMEIIRRLGRAAEYKDNETGFHVIRMSHYARLIAAAVSDDETWVDLLYNAAPMHDIGKIGVPDSILLKKGRLNAYEWEIMQQHPIFGAEIIGDHPSELMKMAAEIALTHHEKWDGSGYPYGLKGEEIPLSSRIIALADVFDALTTERPYKQEWAVEQAMEMIGKAAGKHFDPELVPVMRELLPEMLKIRDKYHEEENHDLEQILQ